MLLTTDRLKLRELLISDLEYVHELHSLPETDRYNTLGIPDSIEVTRQLILTWLSASYETPRKKFVFCIETKKDEFVGLIGINIGRPAYKSAEIWFKLHPDYWNKGFATEAVNIILKFSFKELNLHRIEAGCAIENVASKRVLEKTGMIKEGHCRKILPIRGQWMDNYEFAILDSDFKNYQQENG